MLNHGRLVLIEIKSCGSWVDGVAGLDLVLSLLHLRDCSSPYVLFYGPITMENSLGFVFLIRPRRLFRDGKLVACWSSWFLTLRSFLCLFRPLLRLAESRSGHYCVGPMVTLTVSPDCTGCDEFFVPEVCVTIRAGPRPLVPYGELLISERSLALACPSCQWTHLWKPSIKP
jgi:hypothetical protein